MKKKSVDENKDPIKLRLDALIRLISDLLILQYKVNKKDIHKSLYEIGLTPSDIGSIFGKSRSDIGSELTKMKKKGIKHVKSQNKATDKKEITE